MLSQELRPKTLDDMAGGGEGRDTSHKKLKSY